MDSPCSRGVLLQADQFSLPTLTTPAADNPIAVTTFPFIPTTSRSRVQPTRISSKTFTTSTTPPKRNAAEPPKIATTEWVCNHSATPRAPTMMLMARAIIGPGPQRSHANVPIRSSSAMPCLTVHLDQAHISLQRLTVLGFNRGREKLGLRWQLRRSARTGSLSRLRATNGTALVDTFYTTITIQPRLLFTRRFRCSITNGPF
jgi:hypothetical protein